MKKILFLMIAVLFSCAEKDKYKENLSAMDRIVVDKLHEIAFKMNSKLEPLEILSSEYDTISENKLDSILIGRMLDKADKFLERAKSLQSDAEKEANKVKIYGNLRWNDLRDMAKSDLKKIAEEMKSYTDSVTYYSNLAEEIENRIKSREINKPLYRYKMKMKGVLIENNTGKIENILEEFEHVFTPETFDVVDW